MHYAHCSLINSKRTSKNSEEEMKNTNRVALSKSNFPFKSKKINEECKSCNVDRSLLRPSSFPEFPSKVKFYTVKFLNLES